MPKTTAPKLKTRYVCSHCGSVQLRWAGKCPDCNEWNALTEEVVEEKQPSPGRDAMHRVSAAAPQKLADIRADEIKRLVLPIGEFARVLGGGIVPGSLVLIGGDPGIGKCVTADTRVFDPQTGEYQSIQSYAQKTSSHHVLAVNDTTLKLGSQQVVAYHDQGTRPIVEMTTTLGRRLRCTSSHPVLTRSGWQAVGSLKPGDRIAAPLALPFFGTERMPEEKLKLIAYILSDGSATSQISVTNMLPEVERDLVQIAAAFGMGLVCYEKRYNRAKQFRFTNSREARSDAREFFAKNLRKIKTQNGISFAEWARRAAVSPWLMYQWGQGNCVPNAAAAEMLAHAVGLEAHDLMPEARDQAAMQTPIALFLESVGLRYSKAATKAVPACIFKLPRNEMALFLKTLFTCDGSVYFDSFGHAGVSYSTISLRLAQDVQHLLLRFGLVTKLRTKSLTVNAKPYTTYEVTLHGVRDTQSFLDKIGIMGREEAKRQIGNLHPAQLPSTHKDTVPTGHSFWATLQEARNGDSFAKMRRQTGITIRNRRHEGPLSRYVVQALADVYPHPQLQALGFGDVYWDEIASIEPAGEERVYDITVDQHANFVANDLIIHNSTLLLQAAVETAKGIGTTLYISGEESAHQIKMRAERLGVGDAELYLLTETSLDSISHHLETLKPKLAIIDSIQTMYVDGLSSSPGTVTQVRECAQRLQAIAKASGIAIFIVGHVTKEGNIAGPKVLEHIVDTVLQLEGDRFHSFRMLRSIKNRFGATSEVGVFEMAGSGMIEVTNPSEAFLAERMMHAPGSAVAVTMEGTRPLLVEVQALTSATQNPMPRRTANGFDYNRLFLLIAVLGKRVGIKLHDNDVFLNIVGGMTIDEPAADLAAAIAIASASKGIPVPPDLAIVGEVGLSGEVRSVGQLNARLNEAAKLGFSRCILPKTSRPIEHPPAGLKLLPSRSLGEALDAALVK